MNDNHSIAISSRCSSCARRTPRKLKLYYYVGRVESCSNMRETTRDNDGEKVRLVEMDLRLTKPLSAELYRHLTGDYEE